MRTLIVGDIHLKQKLILPMVDRAIKKYAVGGVVFAGDYCDEYGVTDASFIEALEYLADWKTLKESAGLEVVLLYGNHDFQYLFDSEMGGPGTRMNLLYQTRKLLVQELRPQMAACVDGWLVTHGGILQAWADCFLDNTEDSESMAAQINQMLLEKEYEALFEDGVSGWNDSYESAPTGPLWTFLNEHYIDALRGAKQIVGHTPVLSCSPAPLKPKVERSGAEVWACDAFSIGRSGDPCGDGSMILLEDGVLSTISPEDLGYESGWAGLYGGQMHSVDELG